MKHIFTFADEAIMVYQETYGKSFEELRKAKC